MNYQFSSCPLVSVSEISYTGHDVIVLPFDRKTVKKIKSDEIKIHDLISNKIVADAIKNAIEKELFDGKLDSVFHITSGLDGVKSITLIGAGCLEKKSCSNGNGSCSSKGMESSKLQISGMNCSGDKISAESCSSKTQDCSMEKSDQDCGFDSGVFMNEYGFSEFFQRLGGRMYSSLGFLKPKNIAVHTGFFNEFSDKKTSCATTSIAFGMAQKSYKFDRYKTKNKASCNKEEKSDSKFEIRILRSNPSECLISRVDKINKTIAAQFMVKDMVNEPANVIYPESYANIIKETLAKHKNVSVEIFDMKKLKELNMNALIGVGQGSSNDPRVVVMKYTGNPETKDIHLGLVGKGVTFDSGGLSIKPASGMEDMKEDMAGSAVVFGSIDLLASRNAKVNVVGVVGLVENTINGIAQKPGDIVKSKSGKTIEILNTDAEGRLVLADILYYTKTEFNPCYMIDFATLTGAIVVALANQYAGLFSNNDCLADAITKAGIKSGERCWRLPMGKGYDKMIDSKFADVRNTSTTRGAGSTTAAQFLQRFIDGHDKWAHLDIAGVAGFGDGDGDLSKDVATGFGVKLVSTLVHDMFEGGCK
jgi:leucyl aminopeptidase